MILDLNGGKLQGLGKQEEGKTFHTLHVLGMNDDFWDKVHGVHFLHCCSDFTVISLKQNNLIDVDHSFIQSCIEARDAS